MSPSLPNPGEGPRRSAALKLQLQAVKDELTRSRSKSWRIPRRNVETYRTQLEAVNQQLAALKGQQSGDEKMGKLLTENKELTDKLAAAQKEIDSFKTNPKSKLALAQAQLKNLQDQLAASQAANRRCRTRPPP